MAARRTPWYAAATSAARDVMVCEDRFIFLPARALWLSNITGRGGGNRSGQNGSFIFTMWIRFSIEIFFLVEYDVSLFPATVKTR